MRKNLNLTEDKRKNKILSKALLKLINEISPYIKLGKSETVQLLKETAKKIL